MMNICFLPSICIHTSINFIFIETSMLVDFFPPRKIFFPQNFLFSFLRESSFLPRIPGSVCIYCSYLSGSHLLEQVFHLRGLPADLLSRCLSLVVILERQFPGITNHTITTSNTKHWQASSSSVHLLRQSAVSVFLNSINVC